MAVQRESADFGKYLCPLGSGLGGDASGGRHSTAAIGILHRAISAIKHDQGRDATHTKLGAKGLDLVGGSKGDGEEWHGAIVLLEGSEVAVAGGKHDGQSAGVFLLELLVELSQSRSETTARRALVK